MAERDHHHPIVGESQIDPNSPQQLAAWAETLGVSSYHLSKVIAKVGPVLADIYHALGLRAWEIPKPPADLGKEDQAG